MKNSILLKFVVLSYNHFIRRIEARPKVLMDDKTTKRQVTFRFEGGDYETLDVPGERFADEWREMAGYLASGWPGEIDAPD